MAGRMTIDGFGIFKSNFKLEMLDYSLINRRENIRKYWHFRPESSQDLLVTKKSRHFFTTRHSIKIIIVI